MEMNIFFFIIYSCKKYEKKIDKFKMRGAHRERYEK